MNPLNDEMNEFPGLNAAGRKTPFEVPDGYFDELPHRVSERVHSAPRPGFSLFPRVALAGMAVLMLAWVTYRFADRPESAVSSDMIVVTEDHITESGYLDQIDEALLLESIRSEDLGSISESEEMHEYLIDNKTDINLIINEL